MLSDVSTSLTIGELARRAGVGVETVRFYEREGLLARPKRPASGFRHYPLTSVERVQFIRRAKDLGFSLEEINDLLSLRATRGARCDAVRDHAQQKVVAIDRKLTELRRIRRALTALIGACSGEEGMAACTILEALAGHVPAKTTERQTRTRVTTTARGRR